MHLLCKTPFYKIFLSNAFNDHTRERKSFQYLLYPCISVLELDVLQTLPVRLRSVHVCGTGDTVLTTTAEKGFTVCFYNSLELFPTPQ